MQANRGRLSGEPEDSPEMARCTCGYKKVPDKVGVLDPFGSVEYNPRRVSETSGGHPEQTFQRHTLPKHANGKQAYPAQPEIEQGREPMILQLSEQCESNPNNSEPPNEPKERPTPAAAQCSERKGSIASRDEKIDCRVIKESK